MTLLFYCTSNFFTGDVLSGQKGSKAYYVQTVVAILSNTTDLDRCDFLNIHNQCYKRHLPLQRGLFSIASHTKNELTNV